VQYPWGEIGAGIIAEGLSTGLHTKYPRRGA
jgi:hypothetical protein